MRARIQARSEGIGDGPARAPVLAAALATLLVIVVPFAATGGAGEPSDEVALTPLAQRALAELPSALQLAGRVVVPAASDPGVAWTGLVGEERIDGEVVDLGVRGLVEYGYLPSSGSEPSWVAQVGGDDAVFSDVGPLAYGCMRWPGASTCSGALLVRHDGGYYLLRSGLDVPGAAVDVVRFPALDLDVPTTLLVGTAPSAAVGVTLNVGRREVVGRLSAPGTVGGSTIWWASVEGEPRTLRALDAGGREIAVVDLGR